MNNSSHHLFTYHEVRKKLVQVFGYPNTEKDHEKLHKEIKRVQRMMPKYKITVEHHANIHKLDVNGCSI